MKKKVRVLSDDITNLLAEGPSVKVVPLKVISFTINERYDRFVVLNNGKLYVSRSKGVAGQYYNPWQEWDVLSEIKKDTA